MKLFGLVLVGIFFILNANGQNPLARTTFSSGGSSIVTNASSFGEPLGGTNHAVTIGSQQTPYEPVLIPTKLAQEKTTDVHFAIFPNPAIEELYLNIVGSNQETYTAIIYDEVGNKMLIKAGIYQVASFDISMFRVGLYLLALFNTSNEKEWSQSFIKK